MSSVYAWHFVGDRLRDGRPVPRDGEVLRHSGPLEMCVSGLHASTKIIDALAYAPGDTLCRVRCGGTIVHGDDKLICTQRTILWRVDATEMLYEFVRDCALDVLHLWATEDTPDVDTVVEYLLTGDESLRYAASYAACYAASYAACSAACSAARSAARYAASYAARYAASYAASYACSAASYAACSAQNERLERMVRMVRKHRGVSA